MLSHIIIIIGLIQIIVIDDLTCYKMEFIPNWLMMIPLDMLSLQLAFDH